MTERTYTTIYTPPSDEYLKTEIEIDVRDDQGKGMVMRRCGITSPWFRERATYSPHEPLDRSFGLGHGIYVYDAGHFHEVNAWYENEAAQGRYPIQDPPLPKRKGRKA